MGDCVIDDNGKLLELLAADGRMAQLEELGSWENTLTAGNVDAAMQAASAAGHAEAAAWLLAHHPSRGHAANSSAGLGDLEDLLL